MIAALAALRDHSRRVAEGGWRWVVAGEGPFRGALEAAVREAGLGANVLLAGRISDQDLHGWYEGADLFVHPTLYEGSSLVTLEAMAHRRAVIATTAGGLRDKYSKASAAGWFRPGMPRRSPPRSAVRWQNRSGSGGWGSPGAPSSSANSLGGRRRTTLRLYDELLS